MVSVPEYLTKLLHFSAEQVDRLNTIKEKQLSRARQNASSGPTMREAFRAEVNAAQRGLAYEAPPLLQYRQVPMPHSHHDQAPAHTSVSVEEYDGYQGGSEYESSAFKAEEPPPPVAGSRHGCC